MLVNNSPFSCTAFRVYLTGGSSMLQFGFGYDTRHPDTPNSHRLSRSTFPWLLVFRLEQFTPETATISSRSALGTGVL
ncbi:hypothetical protein B0H12DRAFT_46606 [Mycena haematopus]|nr:hypothetical protein B0H12DRAFT_46606 [Mycena haematopus]